MQAALIPSGSRRERTTAGNKVLSSELCLLDGNVSSACVLGGVLFVRAPTGGQLYELRTLAFSYVYLL